MADRKKQLLEAFNKEESGDDTEVLDNEETGDEESAAGSEQDDSSVVADEPGSETTDESKTEESSEEDGKAISGIDKKKTLKSDSSVSKDSAKDDKTGTAKDASKGAKKAPIAKTLEQTEKEAAEAGEAPKAWKPTIREHWAKLPKDVREEVNRRETEITQFIGRHGAAIQHKAQFDEMVQPFMPFIAAQQSTPMKAFHSLMTTAARLTTGAPQQKAAVISEIMRNYGVDAKTLDDVLTAQMNGSPVPQQQQQFQERPPAWAQPIFSFMQETSQARKAREDRTNQEAAAELAAAEKKPFFSDLQSDIGFLMERATNKGELMTIDQAYDKARKMNPEIDAILTQREKAAKTGTGQSAIDKARKAASTIKGAPGGGVSTGKANGKGPITEKRDRKSVLADAFDAASEE